MELDKLSVQQSFQAALDNTEQTELFWTLDRMHYPDPIKPLEDFFLLQTYKEGFNSATKSYDIPLSFLYRRINHYHYTAIAPLQIPVDELQAQEVSAQKNLTEAVINLPEIWDKQFFPELQSYIKEWKAFDLGKAGLPQLLEHLDRSVIKYGKSYEIHFRIVFPLLVAITIFDEFYTDLFGKDTAFEPYGLLQGFSNKTLESDHELWKLSQEIGKTSEVKEIFINNPAAEVLQLLAQFSEGKKFLLSLQNYLEIYGHRRDKLTMGYPSWIENPLPVIDQLREYIVSKCTDPTESLASLTVERE
ncbi:MAG: hypothetical protein JNN15_17050, partial [Blastocatellia bacterium]|nr:hypothetical protein [Blastocatellia bacterium]